MGIIYTIYSHNIRDGQYRSIISSGFADSSCRWGQYTFGVKILLLTIQALGSIQREKQVFNSEIRRP